MGRPRKQPEGLTIAEKKYIDLSLKTANNINYDELFKKLAIELDREESQIRNYADKLTPLIVDQQLPPEPAPKKLEPHQTLARDLLTPNRNSEPNKARHVTVYSSAAGEMIESQPASVIKGSSRMKECVYRQ